MPLPKEINELVTGEFSHGAITSICHAPFNCIWFSIFPVCATFSQRRRIQHITKEPYICCGGLWPCCGFNKPMPDSFLLVETCMCPNATLAANRFLMQTRFNKRNSGADKVLGPLCHPCVGLQCKVARICYDFTAEQEQMAKSIICVCPLSHCQVGAELNVIEAGGRTYKGPSAALVNALPVHFANCGVLAGVPAAAPVQMKPISHEEV